MSLRLLVAVESVDITAAVGVSLTRQRYWFIVNSRDSGISVEIVLATIMAIQIRLVPDPLHFAQNTATICTTILLINNYLPQSAAHNWKMKFSFNRFEWYGNEVTFISAIFNTFIRNALLVRVWYVQNKRVVI